MIAGDDPCSDGSVQIQYRKGKNIHEMKTAKLSPIFTKHNEIEIGNYTPVSLLNVPSNIL